MPFCRNCGAEIPSESKFCSKCGAPVEQPFPIMPQQITPAKVKEEEAKPVAGLIVSLISGLMAMLGGLAYEGLMAALGSEPTPYGWTSFIVGFLTIIGAVIGYRGMLKLGGTLVILFSLVNLVGLGILAFLPILIGVVGGALILIGK